jgi:dTDP-glucose 4,6-dehydratase
VDDPTQRQPDISKARALLDWEPKVNRHDGLAITYAAFKALPEEILYKQEHRDFKAYIK